MPTSFGAEYDALMLLRSHFQVVKTELAKVSAAVEGVYRHTDLYKSKGSNEIHFDTMQKNIKIEKDRLKPALDRLSQVGEIIKSSGKS